MALEVGIVGLPGACKTPLFTALTKAGGGEYGKTNAGVAHVADRDHVERRLERVEKQAKSGDPKLRTEVEELRKVLAHADAGAPISDFPGELPRELEPLTTKP